MFFITGFAALIGILKTDDFRVQCSQNQCHKCEFDLISVKYIVLMTQKKPVSLETGHFLSIKRDYAFTLPFTFAITSSAILFGAGE